MQEIFNYALYDPPDVVRDVIGFGGPMDSTPLMLLDVSLEMVWAPMVRILADVLERRARRRSTTHVERRPLERTIEVPGMGTFEAGTQGAFRFEVQGIVDGRPLLVVEHVTRIDDDCAPDWPHVDRTGRRAPGAHHRPPEPRRHRPRHRAGRAGRGRRRQRHRGQPHRERHPRGLRRRPPARSAPSTSRRSPAPRSSAGSDRPHHRARACGPTAVARLHQRRVVRLLRSAGLDLRKR